MSRVPLLERAFELAKGGQVTSLDDIQRKLSEEGYGNASSHLSGPSLRKQLKALIVERASAR